MVEKGPTFLATPRVVGWESEVADEPMRNFFRVLNETRELRDVESLDAAEKGRKYWMGLERKPKDKILHRLWLGEVEILGKHVESVIREFEGG